jgi:hypothetical protein
LCGIGNNTPTNVSGFSYYVFITNTSGTFSATTSGELSLVYDSDGNQLAGTAVDFPSAINNWLPVTASFGTVSASSFSMKIYSSTSWSGDVYIDCVQFTP